MRHHKRFFIIWTFILLISALPGTSFVAQAQAVCDAAVDYLALGNEQYSAGNSEGAVSSFTCAIQQHPGSAAAHNGRGNAYRNLGSYEQAIADYTRAIELAPDFALAYNNRGWAYYQQGQYGRALSDYNQAIALDSSLAYAYNNRGLIHQLQGSYDLAIDDFNTAIQLGHDPLSWPQYNLQQALFERDKLGATTVGPTVTATPQSTETIEDIRSLARSYYNNQQYALAAQEYTRLLQLEPDNPDTYFRRAFAYGEIGEYEKAIEDNTRAIELGYSPLQYAYHNRGWDYSQLELYESSIPDFDKAIELDPDYARAYVNRGFVFGRMEQYDKAIADMQSALAKNYENPHIPYNNLGFYYEMLGDLQSALEYYDQSLAVAPDYARALRNRGGVYADLGDLEAAIADFNRAIALEPDSASSYLSRGLYLLRAGDELQAASDYHQWLTLTEVRRIDEGQINRGETRTLAMQEGLVYSFSFNGETGQQINVSATSPDVDSLIVLLGTDGQPLAAADDLSADSADAVLTNYSLPVNGPYTLLVSHAGGGEEGEIALRFEGALSAQALLERGQAFIDQGAYSEAANIYSALLELEPQNLTALYNRGDAYFNLGSYQQAIDDFSAALELDPEAVQTWHYRGVAYERMENYEAALADYNKAIELDPAFLISQFGRGNALQSLGRHDEAIAAYDNVIRLDPDYAAAYNNRGISHDALEQWQSAIDDYTKAMELDPSYNTLLADRANAYLSLEQYEDAIADYQAALDIEPHVPDPYLGLGIAWVGLEDRERAATAFMAYLDYRATDHRDLPLMTADETLNVSMSEGVVYHIPFEGSAGQKVTFQATSEEADPLLIIVDSRNVPLTADDDGGDGLNALIADYELPADGQYTLLVSHAGGGSEGTIRVNFGPQVSLGELVSAGDAARRAGDHTAAIESYTQAIAQGAGDPQVYFNRAFSYGVVGEYALAIADYAQAIELGYTPLARVYYNRAWNHQQLEDYDLALADLNTAIELDPEYAVAYYGRGYLYSVTGRPEAALEDYATALELNYEAPTEIYLDRANLYLDLAQWQNAIDDYNLVLDTEPQNASAFLGRGIAKIGLERRAEAAQDFIEWMDLTQLASGITTRIPLDRLRDGETLTVSMVEGHIYSIPFRGNRGQLVTITAQSQTADTLLVLLSEAGEPLTADDDGGEGLNALLSSFTLPESGDYTILLGHAGGGSSGEVAVTLDFLSQA